MMNLSGNTVLITGGAAGIGLAFAERFIKAGNNVIVCGRREAKLQEAKEKYPAGWKTVKPYLRLVAQPATN